MYIQCFFGNPQKILLVNSTRIREGQFTLMKSVKFVPHLRHHEKAVWVYYWVYNIIVRQNSGDVHMWSICMSVMT